MARKFYSFFIIHKACFTSVLADSLPRRALRLATNFRCEDSLSVPHENAAVGVVVVGGSDEGALTHTIANSIKSGHNKLCHLTAILVC